MQRPYILLVEDNGLDALLLAEQLADDYDFRGAESLVDAVGEIQSGPPGCAIVDLKLPNGRSDAHERLASAPRVARRAGPIA